MNKKRIFKVLIIFVFLIFIFPIFIFLIFLKLNKDAGVGFYESTDISTYRNFGVPDDGGYARIYTFPENLEKVKEINEYYFVANFPPIGTTSWEIFLDVTYSEEEYNLEMERLTNFKGKRELWFDIDCGLFNYPTYICTYSGRNIRFQQYEYIIVDESNYRLVYIYLYHPGRKWYLKKHFREIVVPFEYQPKNYFSNKKDETKDGYYFSIYATEEDLIWFD